MNSPTATSAPTASDTIGLDLGDRRHTFCVLDAAGAIVAEETLTNTRECLEAFSTRFAGATMILETLILRRLRRAQPARAARGSRAWWKRAATAWRSSIQRFLPFSRLCGVR